MTLIRVLALIALLLPLPVGAASLAPPNGMEIAQTLELGFVPTQIAFRPQSHQFVVVGAQLGGSQVVTFDTGTLIQKYLDELPYPVGAVVFSRNGLILYAVGSSNGQGYASAIRLTEEGETRISTVLLDTPPSLPSVAVDWSGRLYIGDAATPYITTIPSFVFDLTKHLKRVVASTFGTTIPHPYMGIRDLAVADSLDLIFVTAADYPEVAAIEMKAPNRVGDQYAGEATKGGASPLPFALSGPSVLDEQNGIGTVSILVGNHYQDVLTVLDVDPLFRALDVSSSTSVKHDLQPGTVVKVLAGTSSVEQPVLLAVNKNQSSILSGNTFSKDLVQFSRQAYGLERIDEVELSAAPSLLTMNDEGTEALVAIAIPREIVVLRERTVGVSENESREKVRQLQRILSELGLPVGAVDGVQGPATDRALHRLQDTTGVSFPIEDLDRSLEVVTQLRDNCGKSSGLRCWATSR